MVCVISSDHILISEELPSAPTVQVSALDGNGAGVGFLGVRTGDGRRVILPEGGEKRTASRGERDLASLGAFCLCVSKPFPSFHKGAKTPLFMSPLPNEGVRESQGERERGREGRGSKSVLAAVAAL